MVPYGSSLRNAFDLRQSAAPLSALDYVAAVLFLVLVLGEAVADAQMFAFQTEKYRRKAAKALGCRGPMWILDLCACSTVVWNKLK